MRSHLLAVLCFCGQVECRVLDEFQFGCVICHVFLLFYENELLRYWKIGSHHGRLSLSQKWMIILRVHLHLAFRRQPAGLEPVEIALPE